MKTSPAPIPSIHSIQVGQTVRVINLRSPSYNRTGLVTMLGSKKNVGLVTVQFNDLPPLTPEERDDPTGFVATFKLLELEIIPSMPKLPYDHIYTLYASLGQSPDQSASTLVNPAMDSIYSEAQWNALTREQQESWLNQQVQTWANSRLHLSWTR